jgi:hypothetical protein
VRGRHVRDVTVLERICDGLGVPREFMRLAGCADGDGAYPGRVTVAGPLEGVDEEMRRRVLMATAGVAIVGRPVDKLGELMALPGPAPVPLPSRIDGIHVAQVRNLIQRLGEAGNAATADPEVVSAAAARASRLLGCRVPSQSSARCWWRWASCTSRLGGPGSTRGATTARCIITRLRWSWPPRPGTHRYGDLDRPAARLALRRGRLDIAESLAAASVRRWEGISPVSHTRSTIMLATVHVRAGERGGLALAHGAITAVTKLSSIRVRRKLEPLAAALEARPGRDAQDLARMARQAAIAGA